MRYCLRDKGPHGEQEGSTLYGTEIAVGPSEKRSLEIYQTKTQSYQGKEEAVSVIDTGSNGTRNTAATRHI